MKAFLKKIQRFFLKLIKWFFIVSVASIILFRWLPIPVTSFMLLQCMEQAYDPGREVKLKKNWVPIDKISPALPLAVICSEDQNFMNHFGFDFHAIEKAVEHNQTHKRKRGASTISQQTAKNVFLYNGRNWVRKALEVYFTFLIELLWNKERIMEVYLNVAEFGDGIYGAEAASQQFFHIPAQKLTRSEAALLAALLPAPRRFSAIHPSPYVRGRQGWILIQMNNWSDKNAYPVFRRKAEK